MLFKLDLILNIIIAILLLVAVFYAAILNNRLKKLRSNKDDVDQAIIRFDQAVNKAEESIRYLRDISGRSYSTLVDTIQKAQSLRDELSFLVERGEDLAEKMENHIRFARKEINTSSQSIPPLFGNDVDLTSDEDKFMKVLKTSKEKEEAQVQILSGETPKKSPKSKAEESLLDMLRSAR